MEARELRIGNWVHNDVEINTFQIEHGWQIDESYEVSGIELTEEWLFNFGFEMFDYQTDDSENDDFIYINYKKQIHGKMSYYTISNTRDGDWCFGFNVIWAEEIMLSQVYYVHELQNLYFALTGNELFATELN